MIAATDLLAAQEGLRRQRLRRALFYGRTTDLMRLGDDTLRARGVDPTDRSAVCRLARRIAGKDDVIGRFLVTD